jgi:3-hydroxyisobutyrate dehydrogenase-like beta-hydroxyacid dehydrogenase
VQHIIKDGRHKVTVWNRSAEKCKPLEAAGAAVAATPREMAASCDIIFSIMPSEATALDIAEQVAAGIRPGAASTDFECSGWCCPYMVHERCSLRVQGAGSWT